MKNNPRYFKRLVTISIQLKRLAPHIGLVASFVSFPLIGCGGGDGSGNDNGSTPVVAVTAPTITAQPASMTVTELQPASFSVAASSGAPLTYQWKRNGTPINGATSATFVIASALAADHSARYSAVVTNSAGSVTSAEAVLTQELPMFLLAGQSNMEGNVDETLFKQLLSELATPPSTDLPARLKERIRYWHQVSNNGYATYGYSDKMATFEASELMRLSVAGLVGANLTTPSSNIFCSWNEPAIIPLIATIDAPKKRCSKETAGPELVFGQALSQAGYSTTSLIKVAEGGTSLFADWRSPLMGGTPSSKQLYAKLRARIQSLNSNPSSVNPACTSRACKWSAFVWFQGEADADSDDASRAAYKDNLKKFVADVRADVGSPNLPVVIVQIGPWAQSLKGNTGVVVANAQAALVKEDINMRLVNTADLSGYYHYDPAAQFIIGERVALAVKSLFSATPAQ